MILYLAGKRIVTAQIIFWKEEYEPNSAPPAGKGTFFAPPFFASLTGEAFLDPEEEGTVCDVDPFKAVNDSLVDIKKDKDLFNTWMEAHGRTTRQQFKTSTVEKITKRDSDSLRVSEKLARGSLRLFQRKVKNVARSCTKKKVEDENLNRIRSKLFLLPKRQRALPLMPVTHDITVDVDLQMVVFPDKYSHFFARAKSKEFENMQGAWTPESTSPQDKATFNSRNDENSPEPGGPEDFSRYGELDEIIERHPEHGG
jgi:hypothetical protein